MTRSSINQRALGTAFVLLAGVLWGSIGLFVRFLNGRGLSPMTVVSVRATLSAVLLVLIVSFTDRSIFRVKLRDLWCFFGTGVLSIVFFNFCYFSTMRSASLAVSAVLLYTAPVFVLLMSAVLFRERMTLRKTVACALALAGCVLVVGLLEGENAAPLGAVLTGLGSGVGYALYSIFSRCALQRGYRPMTVTLYTFLFASVGVLPLTDFEEYGAAFADLPVLSVSVGIALLTTVLPYLLYTTGLSRMDNSRAAIMASVEPVVATVISAVFFREPISLLAGVGILTVIVSIALLNLPEKQC